MSKAAEAHEGAMLDWSLVSHTRRAAWEKGMAMLCLAIIRTARVEADPGMGSAGG
jgi:hypothetical protein